MSKRNARPRAIEPVEEDLIPDRGMLVRVIPLVILGAVVASVAIWVRPALRERVGTSFDEGANVRIDWPIAASSPLRGRRAPTGRG